MKTLVFNGKKYRQLNGGAIGDCNGFYVTQSNGVRLYKPNKKLEAFIVNNRQQGYFVVTASTTSEGVPRFMFSTCSLTEKWLGIEVVGMADTHEMVKAMYYLDNDVGQDGSQQQIVELATA